MEKFGFTSTRPLAASNEDNSALSDYGGFDHGVSRSPAVFLITFTEGVVVNTGPAEAIARISKLSAAMDVFPNSTITETASTGFPESEVNMDALFQSLQNDPRTQSTSSPSATMFHDPQLVPQSEFGRNIYEVVHVRVPRVRALAREVISGM